MKGSLRVRLAVTHMVVAVVAIVVVGAIVAYTGSRRFDGYLQQIQERRAAAIAGTLQSTYRTPQGWDATAIYAVSQVASFNRVNVAVYDLDGRLLFTVQGRGQGAGLMDNAGHAGGMGSGAGGGLGQGAGGGVGVGVMGGANSDDMMGAGACSAAANPSPATWSGDSAVAVQTTKLQVDGDPVGTALIATPRGARAVAEEAYQSDLTRNLIIAALVAGALALLVSLLVSHRITGPVEELTAAASDVAAGRLDARVATRGDGEVAALADAFNAMADRLARDEQWRRDMTSDLSHELRSPLATIQARVEALEDGVLPATPANLRVIGEEVERLGRLLTALRSLNDLEREDLETSYERVDVGLVAAAAIERHRPAFAAKEVELITDIEEGLVLGNEDRLAQVVGNLLDNALKFTTGGGTVEITARGPAAPPPADTAAIKAGEAGKVAREDAAAVTGSVVRMTVSDDGPGVDPADMPFIFDRFYRAQGARSEPGAGLGLAICRALVEAHGGAIDVEAADGGGARLVVLLPAAGPQG